MQPAIQVVPLNAYLPLAGDTESFKLKLELITKKDFSPFDFKSIVPRFQQRMHLIVKTPEMECNTVISLVLNKNRSLFLILSRFLHVFSNGYQ